MSPDEGETCTCCKHVSAWAYAVHVKQSHSQDHMYDSACEQALGLCPNLDYVILEKQGDISLTVALLISDNSILNRFRFL